MGEVNKLPFDVFICYKRSSAEEMALRLREALKEYDISAFVDTMDIPKEYEFTDKWWQYRDDAIRKCDTFLMIVTVGFEKSTEIADEIKIARDSNRKLMLFRWHKLYPEIIINLGDELLNIKDLQQISFDSPGMLVTQFFDNYKRQYNKEQRLSIQKTETATKVDKPVPPLVHYEITQQIRDTILQRQLPNVGFNIRSWHPEPIKARIKARVILGGQDLGMEKSEYRNGKYFGYYNGKTEWNLNPYGMVFGNFSIPLQCATSKEALTIEVTVTLKDQKGRTFEYLPVSYTFMRNVNSWFYEPASF